MKIIGVTGGIASGKSTVIRVLKECCSYPVIDADQLARQAVEPRSQGLQKIADVFGENCLNEKGELNRSLLGEIIAEDEESRKKLNAIVHPEVKRLYDELINFYENNGVSLVFYDCPLLFEANLESDVDETMLVVADEEIRINRIMERDGVSRELAIKKIAMQMTDDEKIKRADIIIENNGSRDDLRMAIRVYFNRCKPGMAHMID
ncbi:dephospho-CoA kinase [Acetobacterium paludosum]|uniref:Dephospho-CoA kinase n=1 Tax=Acetobacterium paludosum TaxID=52693 RepID=A0A923KW28_9FIRM|nr:dephospho-CoA kinase [Acetobacterium paludosum]MBC3887613.1 dephospho-CoA kinase [Acetobacterium paludosum]